VGGFEIVAHLPQRHAMAKPQTERYRGGPRADHRFSLPWQRRMNTFATATTLADMSDVANDFHRFRLGNVFDENALDVRSRCYTAAARTRGRYRVFFGVVNMVRNRPKRALMTLKHPLK